MGTGRRYASGVTVLALVGAAAAADPPVDRPPPGEPFSALFRHGKEVTGVVFAPDGSWFASASWDRTLVVRDPDGRDLRTIGEPGEEHSGLAVSGDGRRLATGSPAGRVAVWDVATGRRVRALPEQPGHIYGVALSPDGRLVAACGQAQEVLVWAVATGREVSRLRGHVGRVWQVHFAPDGRSLVSCADDDTVRLWDLDSGRVRVLARPPAATDPRWGLHTYRCAFSPDGRLVAAGTSDGELVVWEATTGAPVATGRPRDREPIHALAFAPDGRRVLTGHAQGRVCAWDLPAGRVVGQTNKHIRPVYAVAAAPDGRHFVSCGQDRLVHLWDDATFAASDRAFAAAPPRATRDPDRLWAALADQDAGAAYRAVWELAADPRVALPLLKDRLRPLDRARGERTLTAVPGLVADLDAPRFAAREAAARRLAESGPIVVPPLREALRRAASAEVRARLERLIERLADRTSGDEATRESRALAAVEQVGGPDALAHLRELAGGHPGAPLTVEAGLALARAERRARPPTDR